jgi:hypothetical protein
VNGYGYGEIATIQLYHIAKREKEKERYIEGESEIAREREKERESVKEIDSLKFIFHV